MPKEDTQFKPGADWKGNAGGRPRNPLKEFSRKEFESWDEKKKRKFLKKVTAIDRWKMTEGNPDSDVNVQGEVITKIISIDE